MTVAYHPAAGSYGICDNMVKVLIFDQGSKESENSSTFIDYIPCCGLNFIETRFTFL